MTEEIDVCVQAPTELPMRLRLNAMLASILSQSDNIVDNDGAHSQGFHDGIVDWSLGLCDSLAIDFTAALSNHSQSVRETNGC